MSKTRKTRKEKIIADINRQLYSLEPQITSSLSTSLKKNTTISYSYLLQDVLKTGILTASIIGSQIILFFLLKRQVIILPNINY